MSAAVIASQISLPNPTPLRPPPLTLLNGASLFLDFDGTLVEIVGRPDDVAVDDRLSRLMERLAQRTEGRLAIVSGRSVSQIQQLFAKRPFAVSGSHGLEMSWPDGRTEAPARPPGLEAMIAEMQQLKALHPGIVVEEKPFGVGLHFRQAPQAAGACEALAIRLARESGLSLQPGKMVFEIRLAGANKGSAIEAFLNTSEMAGTIPIFLGDDETDEAGFVVAAERGGAGILVGPERPTAARYRLNDVTATRDWLEAAAEEHK